VARALLFRLATMQMACSEGAFAAATDLAAEMRRYERAVCALGL
jgi:hypothetical protein